MKICTDVFEQQQILDDFFTLVGTLKSASPKRDLGDKSEDLY